MATRAYWSGDLCVGPFTIPVQAGKALGADERDEGLKRLCACHTAPFTRFADECPGGKHPWSQAAADRGEDDLTEVVYGTPAQVDDDGTVTEWAVLDSDVLDEIRQAAKLEDLEIGPDDVVAVDELPHHLFLDPWYLWPKVEKGKTNEKRIQSFAALVRTMEARGLALVTLWTPRITSRPKLVTIHAVGDALLMNVLPFRPEVREPEAKMIAHAEVDLPQKAIDIMGAILSEMQGSFAYAKYEDKTIGLRRQAIDEALAGEPITRRERPVTVAAPEDDLMASLEASLKLVKSGDVKTRMEVAA